MFDWIGELIDAVVGAIQDGFEWIGETITSTIWTTMLRWFYETIYNAVADFFELIGNMGADIFELEWVEATVKLFTLFGWALFVAGLVVAIFDVAVEYQNGRANIKTTAINILKGFFACSLIGVVPIELYKFCITLQNTFAHDLSALGGAAQSFALSITNSGSPSFREISKAFDFPGIPIDKRYVGLSVVTSNSTEAFSTFSVVSANSFSSL